MSKLQDKIMDASQKYYSGENISISDTEFDSMIDQLREEDPDNPILTDTGHGYDVNKDNTPGEKIEHKYGYVGSLNKCHSLDELPKYFAEDNIYASLKLDGLSVVLYYKEGKLERALTRGSDNIGIDITEFAAYILKENIYLEDNMFTGGVRGEIVMSNDNFEIFKKDHPEAKNPRNSVAGLKNSNKITPELALVDIVVYSLTGIECNGYWNWGYQEMMSWLESQFTHVVDMKKINLSYLDNDSFMNVMENLRTEWYGKYPADGIVLSQNEITCKHNKDIFVPNLSQIAFKFKAESKVTDVLGVEWKLSKTKNLVPRIHLKTVELSGTNVSYCAGHNAQFIYDNLIGKGAKVRVYKSGEIIPYLEEVIEPGDCELPKVCPECGEPLKVTGVHISCPNRDCGDIKIQDTLVWMENISPHDGLGDILKLKFLEEKFGDDISIDAIYNAGQIEDEFDSIQASQFKDMYNGLFTNKVKLKDAIKALNIPRFGDVTSAKLAKYPDEVKLIVRFVAIPRVESKENIDIGYSRDISDKIGEANYKSMVEHIDKFKPLVYIYDNIDWSVEESKGKVAITGKLSVKRSDFEKELNDSGWQLSNISKDTDYLITDNPDSNSEKNKKADKYGVTKITESDFRKNFM